MAILIDESFEGEGYEESWSETVGDGSIDPDATDVSRPADGGDQCLKSIAIEGVGGDSRAYALRDLGADKAITNTRIYFMVDSHNITSGNEKRIIRAFDAATTNTWIALIVYDGSNTHLKLGVYYNGANQDQSTIQIVLGRWYRLEVLYNVTGTSFETRLDGMTKHSGTLTGAIADGVRYLRLGADLQNQNFDITSHFDLIKLRDDTTWNGWESTDNIKSQILLPNGDSDVNWTPSTPGDHYSLINDDDNDTYVETNVVSKNEYFTFATPGIAEYDGVPIEVRMWCRGKEYSSTVREIKMRAQSGGTYEQDRVQFTANFEDYYLRPQALIPPTWDQLDALVGGPGTPTLIETGIGARVSKVWAQIIYGVDSSAAWLIGGPLFGGVTNNQIKVWVRTDKAATVKIRYGTDEQNVKDNTGDTQTTSGQTTASEDDFCTTFTIGSLSTNTLYYFTVLVDDQLVHVLEGSPYWSSLPSCKTFPTEGVDADIDILVAGDMHNDTLNYRIWASMAAKNCRAFIDLGDHAAINGDDASEIVAKHQNRRTFEINFRHAMYNIVKSHPLFFVKSDHDMGGNNCHKFGTGDYGQTYVYERNFINVDHYKRWHPWPTLAAPDDVIGTATGGSATTLIDSGASFLSDEIYPGMVVHHTSLSLAYSFVHSVDSDIQITLSQALSSSESFSDGDDYRIMKSGLWYKFTIANAEFFVMDQRSKRDPNTDGMVFVNGDMLDGRKYLGNSYSGGNDDSGGGSASGHIQRDWLINGVNNSTKKWKIILSDLSFKYDEIVANDKWGDYDPNDAQRNYLKSQITADNVIWINADRHFASLDDASHADDPWPLANCSPLHCQNFDSHDANGTYLVNNQNALWDKSDGCDGAFGVLKIGKSQITIELYKQDGTLINNGACLFVLPVTGDKLEYWEWNEFAEWSAWHLGSDAIIKGNGLGFKQPSANAYAVSPVLDTDKSDLQVGYAGINMNQGTANFKIRGAAEFFNWDAENPSWESYSGPENKNWRYVQMKIERVP